MRLTTIRARMLAATLLPIVLIVLILVGVFSTNRFGEMDEAHRQSAKLLVRQVALSSEYGLFSGNVASLQAVVNGVKREAEVQSAVVFDFNGKALATSGTPIYQGFDDIGRAAAAGQLGSGAPVTLIEVIRSDRVQLDDLFTQQSGTLAAEQEPAVLGYAVIEVSRTGLESRQQDMLQLALGVGLVGLLLAGFLAIQLGEGVVQPILRISRMINQVGQGDLLARIKEVPSDPLHELQVGLNHMAARLAWGRDEMEMRVASVTAELRERKNEAEEATLAKSRFLAAASHDPRQPTHALGMFVARLSQSPMDVPTRSLVNSVEASVQAMQDLLDDLLDLSRLEAGAVHAEVAPVEMQAVFDNIRSAMEPFAQERGLRLRVRNSPLWALTDAVLLQRVLMNLVHNAVRYTTKGTVLLACRTQNGGRDLRVEVSDSGIGISPEHQAEIFKEFFQVGNIGRDRSRGLGLGLNIVERSVALLGHKLELRSALGRGTRFSIIMPRTAALLRHTGDAHVVVDPPAAAALIGIEVLVLEDDDFARDALSSLLHSWGCKVLPCATSEEALQTLDRHGGVDFLLSDYRLADGDQGIDAIARLRECVGRKVPACLMSGDTDSALMQAAKEAGLPLLHKPVRPAKLRSVLRRILMSAGGDAMDSAYH